MHLTEAAAAAATEAVEAAAAAVSFAGVFLTLARPPQSSLQPLHVLQNCLVFLGLAWEPKAASDHY